MFSQAKYQELINEVKHIKFSKEPINKCPREYCLQQHYDVLSVQGVDKLIVPLRNNNHDIIYYAHGDEMFDILHGIHISTDHGGRDRMIKKINEKYKNITRAEIMLFLSLCKSCQQKQKREKKEIVTNPMVFKELNSRCQVDLIDFQAQPDKTFKFLMVYQDQLTKFVVLRALESKTAIEVVQQLVSIFAIFGAPSVLQSDNGREFANTVIESLKDNWPDLKIVHGKPRHSHSQGSVERANEDIENMITKRLISSSHVWY